MSVIPPTNQSYIYWKQRFNEVAAELNIAESKLAKLEGLERAASMALQQLYHANAGAFENGVTDSTGSTDEGNVRAGEIIHDLELALGVSRHGVAYASENGE